MEKSPTKTTYEWKMTAIQHASDVNLLSVLADCWDSRNGVVKILRLGISLFLITFWH